MKKISKTFRIDPIVVNELEELVKIHQKIHDDSMNALYSNAVTKKVTMTDVIEMLIKKEYELQKPY